MDAKTVLTKAIQKALDNGWKDPFGIVQFKLPHSPGIPNAASHGWDAEHGFLATYERRWFGLIHSKVEYYHLSDIFFDHTWYNTEYRWNCAERLWGKDWKKHVAKMVIADDPIKYLGENI